MSRLSLVLISALSLTGCGSYGLGVTPGGSQDIGLARDLIAAGQVPDQEHFTAEGLFSEHDLPLDGAACDEVICPRGAVTEHVPLDGSPAEALLQVGFGTNLDADSFERAPLDVAAVVDISCSMGGDKLAMSKEAMLAMVDQLGEGDRMALVTFGSRARVVRESRPMTEARKASMRRAIDGLHTRGSTSLEAGMRRGFEQLSPTDGVESRMMLFTDAQPNTGVTEQSEFVAMTREAAATGIGTTVFGTGTDLGSELADAVSRVRGGSYHYLGEDDVDRLFVDEFDYLVTPLAYDFEATLSPLSGLAVREVYGAPTDGQGEVSIAASTLFASARSGGIAAILDGELVEGSALARMTASWEPRDGGDRVVRDLDIRWDGGGFVGASDQLGVHKIALLVDEIQALTAAAELCDGTRERDEVFALLDATVERLATEASLLEDAGIQTEAELIAQLRDNAENGTCAAADTYLY